MKQILPSYLLARKHVIIYLGRRPHLDAVIAASTESKQFATQIIHLAQIESALTWLQKKAQELSLISTRSFAIVCDDDFARQDDYFFLENIRKNSYLSDLPLFVYTEQENLSDDKEFLQRGVNDYFTPQLDVNDLNERLNFWLHYKAKIKNYKSDKPQFTPKSASFFKRLLDLAGASIILLLLSPILLLIALAIKLESKGPVLYTSKRVGTNYQIFEFLKFRSMYQNADKKLQELAHLNQYQAESDNCFVKISNDPRVTRIGRLIRKTSLDELPQLLNVVRGEMSLIGNRPLPLYEAEFLTRDDWAGRFLAPAGLTGLWQVTKRGKNTMSTQERVKLDLDYANQHSFWYDIGILLRTLPAMVQEENV